MQAATTLPIIWDYVKCLPCNGRSPFAPSPSNRQCSYNLYGQLPNRKPTIPLLPIQGCSKMVQRVSGFSQFLQPLYCCLLVPERSRRILAIQSLPSPRTAVLQAEENCFIHSNILSTHQKHLSFIGRGFQCVYGACWKRQDKAFSFSIPYHCLCSHFFRQLSK